MKLTTLLLITAILQVSASSFAQKVTLSETNAPINKVFDQISQQTGFDFLVTKSVLQKANPVTLDVKGVELNDVLKVIFLNQPLLYEINDKVVLVKELSFLDKIKKRLTTDQTIRGSVKDSAGVALPGATVTLIRLDGTAEGGIAVRSLADAAGNFLFDVEQGKYRLEVSYIGYKPYTKEIIVDKQDIYLDLILKTAENKLAEVAIVNTGYQKIKIEQATGSYNIISKEQIEKPATDIASRLIGTTAGLQFTQNTDGSSNFELRGLSRLNANPSPPLFVVDGFPVTGNLSSLTGTIDPNDVESITVLKDAAASSIWGAQAANGVIVITTKHPKKGTPLNIQFSAFTQFSPKFNVGYATGLASSSQTVDYEQRIYNKYGNSPINNSIYGTYQLSDATVALNENYLGYITNDQLNAELNKLKTQDNRQQISDYLLANPVTTQYNLTLSGATEKLSSYVSLEAQRDQYSFKGNKDQQYNFNYNTTANVFKWLDVNIGANIQYVNTVSNGVSLVNLQSWSPYNMLKNPDGSLTNVPQYYMPILNRVYNTANFPYPDFSYNPIQEIANRNILTPELNTRIQGGLTFKIIPGLTYDIKGQYEYLTRTFSDYEDDQTFFVRNAVNTSSTVNSDGTVTANLPLGGILQNQERYTISKYIIRNQLNFNHTFSQLHEINIVAGAEITSAVNQAVNNPTTYGYDNNTLTVGSPNLGPTLDWQGNQNYYSYNNLNSYYYAQQRFYSLFANANYTYAGKYTLSASYRTDASNLITNDPKYRYRPFGSLGLSYDISKERFMQGIDWLDNLKLRGTFGYNGNVDASTSPYTLIALNSVQDPYSHDHTGLIQTNGNPLLRWERTGTLNLGTNFSIFKGRLYGSVDYYDKEGRDLLTFVSLSSVDGGSFGASFNNASMSNKGIEVVLGTSLPIKGNNIIWKGSINGAYNRNKVISVLNTNYYAPSMVSGFDYLAGYNANTAWAYQYAGLVNGQPALKGSNGTTIPLGSIPDNGDGRTFLKNMGTYDQPYILGMTNSFKIYDFDFSFIMTAKYGGVFRSQAFNFMGSNPNSQIQTALNGDPNKVLTLPTDPNIALYTYSRVAPYLSYNYLNAGLLRMQEMNLTYNLPPGTLSNINIKHVQLALQGNNLFSFFSNKKSEDPEFIPGTVKPVARYIMSLKLDL